MISHKNLSLPGLLIIEPPVFRDDRGYFSVSYQLDEYAEAGIPSFIQDNISFSRNGTLRGLHYQVDSPQGKLIQVLAGRIFDVAVDLRKSSPKFGQWEGLELDSVNLRQLWIPPGFAHGFFTISDEALVVYKVTARYLPENERTIRWDDADLKIQWPAKEGQPLVSEKDKRGSSLKSAEAFE